MAVHVDHTGNDTLVAVVNINRLCTVFADGNDLAAVNPDLCGKELIGEPNFLTLNKHGMTPL